MPVSGLPILYVGRGTDGVSMKHTPVVGSAFKCECSQRSQKKQNETNRFKRPMHQQSVKTHGDASPAKYHPSISMSTSMAKIIPSNGRTMIRTPCNENRWEIWAEAVQPTISKLMVSTNNNSY